MSRDVRYRFHGSTPPEPGRRQPLAALTASDPKDGVATIRLYDVIDSWGGDWGVSAREFADVLDGLPSDVKEIRLHINSPGGEVFEGIAITNLLRQHPARVVAVVDGLAASAASFIAVTANETVMGQNTQMMIHDGWGICIGSARDMHSTGDLLDHLSDNIAAMYAAKAGGETAAWRELMLAETWFSAEEAVTAKLADRVEAGTGGAPENRFDLSDFRYQGRLAAPAPRAPAAAPPIPVPAVAASSDRGDLVRVRHRMNERRAAALV
jgi:ATP-dependent protease ClpP protease subunit